MHSHPRGLSGIFFISGLCTSDLLAAKVSEGFLVGFPSFLRQFWKVPENRSLLFFLVGKGIGKIIRKKKIMPSMKLFRKSSLTIAMDGYLPA